MDPRLATARCFAVEAATPSPVNAVGATWPLPLHGVHLRQSPRIAARYVSPLADHSVCLAIYFYQSIYTRVRPLELRLQASTLHKRDARFSAKSSERLHLMNDLCLLESRNHFQCPVTAVLMLTR